MNLVPPCPFREALRAAFKPYEVVWVDVYMGPIGGTDDMRAFVLVDVKEGDRVKRLSLTADPVMNPFSCIAYFVRYFETAVDPP